MIAAWNRSYEEQKVVLKALKSGRKVFFRQTPRWGRGHWFGVCVCGGGAAEGYKVVFSMRDVPTLFLLDKPSVLWNICLGPFLFCVLFFFFFFSELLNLQGFGLLPPLL